MGSFCVFLECDDLLFVETTVTLHEVNLLQVFKPCLHLNHKVIGLMSKKVGILCVPSAHNVCHAHIIPNGGARQLEAFYHGPADNTDNLLFVDTFGMADALSIGSASPKGKTI